MQKESAPILTVDVVLLTVVADELRVALFRRDVEPFAGTWALPGGYVHKEEDTCAKDAAVRVLREKAGVVSPYLEEFGTFSGPARDPRGWSLTVVHYALVPASTLPSDVTLFSVSALPPLPFDHRDIVESVLARVRSKAGYSSLPAHLCGDAFTLPELEHAYEIVRGEPLPRGSFRRKLDELGFLEPIEGQFKPAKKGAAVQLYRLAPAWRQALAVRERGI